MVAIEQEVMVPPGVGRIAADGGAADGAAATSVRRVEHVMGTVIGIDIRDAGALTPNALVVAIDAAFAWLRDVDERFSPFRATSQISRLARGEIDASQCSTDVRWILGLCDDLARTTDGYFDARHHRPDGMLDPSGVVKGWAVEEAAWMLERSGATSFAINAGGDVIVRTVDGAEKPWRVGIRDPRAADRVVTVLEIRNGSVATSGAYERGEHVIDPHTGRPHTGLLSISVVGPSLTDADAYATAALAMGRQGVRWIAEHDGYGAFGITRDGRAIWTSVVDGLLA